VFKIVLIAPGDEIAKIGREVIAEMNEPIEIVTGVMDTAVEIAKTYDKESIYTLVSRGGTAAVMKNSGIQAPIIEIPITGGEFVIAINTAKKVVKKSNPVIGYIGFENMISMIKLFMDILDVDLKIYELNSRDDIEKKVLQAKNDKIDVIIGGISTVECAIKHNIQGVFITTTKDSLRVAFNRAKEINYARMLEQKKSNELKGILNSAFEAIIGIDDIGIITVFNSAAELFFNVKTYNVIGKKVTEVIKVFDENLLSKVLVYGESIFGKIVKINNDSVIYNFTPILVNSKIVAAIISFQEIHQIERIETEIRKVLYLKGNCAQYNFDNIKGVSAEIEKTKKIAETFSKLDSIILIIGETGTGKELFAQSIHNSSLRSEGPFVAVNCGAISSNLLESELFGYVDGAFTGAKKGGKKGLFEIAHNGTIFLDEISEMSMYGQTMLLRVIQEKQIRRVGDDSIIPVNVRIIAATNKPLLKLVEEKKFREDLFYRLNVLSLSIPPLRERDEDIEYLLKYFIHVYSKKFYKYVELTEESVHEIKNFPWYGNVRELEGFCERLVAIASQRLLDRPFILEQLQNQKCLLNETNSSKIITDVKLLLDEEIYKDEASKQIIQLLQKYNSNKNKVAEELGISRTTLWRKIKQYNIKCEFYEQNNDNHRS
jgi:transcriptional regulator with PAS, ATPase and Fis domain